MFLYLGQVVFSQAQRSGVSFGFIAQAAPSNFLEELVTIRPSFCLAFLDLSKAAFEYKNDIPTENILLYMSFLGETSLPEASRPSLGLLAPRTDANTAQKENSCMLTSSSSMGKSQSILENFYSGNRSLGPPPGLQDLHGRSRV